MHNLIRLYNQNRLKIWIIVIGIIIAITLVQIVNNAIKESNIEKTVEKLCKIIAIKK